MINPQIVSATEGELLTEIKQKVVYQNINLH